MVSAPQQAAVSARGPSSARLPRSLTSPRIRRPALLMTTAVVRAARTVTPSGHSTGLPSRPLGTLQTLAGHRPLTRGGNSENRQGRCCRLHRDRGIPRNRCWARARLRSRSRSAASAASAAPTSIRCTHRYWCGRAPRWDTSSRVECSEQRSGCPTGTSASESRFFPTSGVARALGASARPKNPVSSVAASPPSSRDDSPTWSMCARRARSGCRISSPISWARSSNRWL
jgi:hypothetical protein